MQLRAYLLTLGSTSESQEPAGHHEDKHGSTEVESSQSDLVELGDTTIF